jgi:hypothetical protein
VDACLQEDGENFQHMLYILSKKNGGKIVCLFILMSPELTDTIVIGVNFHAGCSCVYRHIYVISLYPLFFVVLYLLQSC